MSDPAADLPPWAERQAAVILAMLQAAVEAVRDGHPADRTLHAQFAKNKKYGSRDRRLIGDCVFSWFRWHGAVGELPLPRGLCVAWFLDGADWSPPLRAILRDLDWPEPEPPPLKDDPDLEQRRQAAQDAFDLTLPPVEDWLPDWWRDETAHLGDYADRLKEHVHRPPTWLRVDKARRETLHDELLKDGAEWAGPSAPAAYAFRNPGKVHRWLSEHGDAVEIQDIASQQIVRVCDPRPGQRWWDACCGGGGKSLQLLDEGGRDLDLTCTDRREGTLKELVKRGRRHGLGKVRRYVLDLLKEPELPNIEFDGVLLDAACSGSGTWTRNPDAAWRTEASDVRQMGRRQLAMLDTVAPTLRAGGVLVYAVCSLARSETLDVLGAFLSEHPDFTLDPFPHPFDGTDTDGSLFLLPGAVHGDGMFVARLVKN